VWSSYPVDVTARKTIEDEIRNLAFYDELTKQPNRRLLNDRLVQCMAASKRSGRYGALMFLDMDNFKPLNDTHGHHAGDLLLVEVARRINKCVREVDTVSRFGGDEFVVMLNELNVDKAKSIAEAGIVAEKIRVALAEPYLLTIQQKGKAETTVTHHCTSSIRRGAVHQSRVQHGRHAQVGRCGDVSSEKWRAQSDSLFRFKRPDGTRESDATGLNRYTSLLQFFRGGG